MLRRGQPDVVRHRFDLGLSERSIGELEAACQNFLIARQHLLKAQQVFEKLSAEFPNQEEYATHREGCGQALAQIERLLEKRAEAPGS